jgi:ubiquinone/menaquinone biosynthesis C-methylase UbiE
MHCARTLAIISAMNNSSDTTKRLVRQQFGPHAAAYVSSEVHAAGYSLSRLFELANPRPDWQILDIATGGGHTARTFAASGASIIAGDLTHAMLTAARDNILAADIHHVMFCQHDAEALPFSAKAFDAVTCRLAPHHFPDITRFLSEVVRVLKPGGCFALADNAVSGEPAIARFANAVEKLHDPSHNWAYSVADWETFVFSAGLELVSSEISRKERDLDAWAGRMGVEGADLDRLRAMILQAPDAAREWIQPRRAGNRVLFTMAEIILLARKP